MKVGDLVQVCGSGRPVWEGKFGVIIATSELWEERACTVLFGSEAELMFESGLELISESR